MLGVDEVASARRRDCDRRPARRLRGLGQRRQGRFGPSFRRRVGPSFPGRFGPSFPGRFGPSFRGRVAPSLGAGLQHELQRRRADRAGPATGPGEQLSLARGDGHLSDQRRVRALRGRAARMGGRRPLPGVALAGSRRHARRTRALSVRRRGPPGCLPGRQGAAIRHGHDRRRLCVRELHRRGAMRPASRRPGLFHLKALPPTLLSRDATPPSPPAPARARPPAPRRSSSRSESASPRAPPVAPRPNRRGCAQAAPRRSAPPRAPPAPSA